MARIKLFDNSADDIKDVHKRKYKPSKRYKDIIEKTNKRIDENQHKSDIIYERASKFMSR